MKKFLLNKDQIKKLINSTEACVVSKRILVDGQKAGYMYRETPSTNYPDSGWRILAGDETQDYVDCAENLDIVELNTVCNYDESIIPLLDAPIGTSLLKNEKGEFEQVENENLKQTEK